MTFENISRNFANTTVLVIGDFMLDRYIYGQVSRISPEAPVPLVDITHEEMQLGGAANAVRNICAFGGNAIAAGIVGDDWFGKKLIRLFEDTGINAEGLLVSKERPTTVKTRIIAESQHIIRFDKENRDPISSELEDELIRFIEQKIGTVDAILIADYNKGVITSTLLSRLLSLSIKSDKPLVVYPKLSSTCYYRGVTLAITTRENACAITGIRQINETSMRNMGYWLLSHLESRNVLIVQNRNEFFLFNENREMTQIITQKNEPQNITSEIDTIAGLIALSLPGHIAEMKEILNTVNEYMNLTSRQFPENNFTPAL